MPHFKAYGLGWQLLDYRGRKIVRHFGETDGISSIVALIPEEHLGVIILTNMHTTSMHEALSYWIFDAFLRAPQEDWSAKFLEEQKDTEEKSLAERKRLEENRVRGTKPSLPLEQYTGSYENDVYGSATVSKENRRLIVRLSATPTCIGDLDHWDFDTFEARWSDPVFERGFVKFILDGEGTVDQMKVRVAGYVDPSQYIFTKVPEPSSSVQKSR